jgi:ribosomal protein S18 acetylase RimI-like enzyme
VLGEWIVRARAAYVDERIAAGDSAAEATANADATLARLFPAGSPAPGQLVGRVVADGTPVGTLWIGPAESDTTRWWVWDIVIDEKFRGRGFGRQAMQLAETIATDGGATSLGLNVFAHNAVARALYASMGYEESSIQMRKRLTDI